VLFCFIEWIWEKIIAVLCKAKVLAENLSLEFSDLEYFGSNAICPQAHYLYFAVITLLTLTVLEAFRKCKKIVTLFDNNDL
jgi:hypothetical protein|tara:strand:+ start:1703 stop:1945 length:243 start_codon:yes stop_codon:yes gene_type:complete